MEKRKNAAKAFKTQEAPDRIIWWDLALILFAAFPVIIYATGWDIGLAAKLDEPRAKAAAVSYIKEKYGYEPEFSYGEPLYEKGRYEGTVFRARDGYSVFSAKNCAADDRQYDEITAAFEERFFEFPELGTPVFDYKTDLGNALSAYIDFRNVSCYDFYSEYHSFTDVYFDGDIEKFLLETRPYINFRAEYYGYNSDKFNAKDNIPAMKSRLEEICRFSRGLTGEITVYDPCPDEKELPDNFRNSVRVRFSNDDGTEKITEKVKILTPADEYTLSLNTTDGQAIKLAEKDLSEDTLPVEKFTG